MPDDVGLDFAVAAVDPFRPAAALAFAGAEAAFFIAVADCFVCLVAGAAADVLRLLVILGLPSLVLPKSSTSESSVSRLLFPADRLATVVRLGAIDRVVVVAVAIEALLGDALFLGAIARLTALGKI